MWSCKHILPGVPVCSSGNICGPQEWGMSEQMPCEPSSGASLLWMQESRQIENVSSLLKKKFNKLVLELFPVTSSPKKDRLLTSKRLKLHKAATTAAVQDSVLGHCRVGLPMGTDFGHTVASIIHFKKRTQSHLKFKKEVVRLEKLCTLLWIVLQ